ncbi:predicted protein [Naegleria gruberi]|uniref:Predicted protein n=1 Tax=Naegleria gruberi TaxID=5762 RepID=D2VJD4_NAEGR|nr:uncharacterized protein NAEGRDRAFT_68998 [Naegleria gruberi]EFC42925.1 predicted protein [Naegleria gruberi]|eukprot:XP_002675669.1 predicted protein [Naegleria gruberi strain NEG-M]
MLFEHRYISPSSVDVMMKNQLYQIHNARGGIQTSTESCFNQQPDHIHYIQNQYGQMNISSHSYDHHYSENIPQQHNYYYNNHEDINQQLKTNYQNIRNANTANGFISISEFAPLNENQPPLKQTNLNQPKQSKPPPSTTSKLSDPPKSNLEQYFSTTDFNDIVVQQSTNQQQTNDNQASYNGKDRYKTELCRSWEETGYCRYGDKCQFAHGRHELRLVTRHHKYKSELCNNYHYEGTCMYGIRCCFIHSIDRCVIGRALSQNIDMVPIHQTSRLPVFQDLKPTPQLTSAFLFTNEAVNQ